MIGGFSNKKTTPLMTVSFVIVATSIPSIQRETDQGIF